MLNKEKSYTYLIVKIMSKIKICNCIAELDNICLNSIKLCWLGYMGGM